MRRPNVDIRKAAGNTSVDTGRDVWGRERKERAGDGVFKSRR